MGPALFAPKFGFLFLQLCQAEIDWLLLEFIRLSGHGGLVCHDTRALDDKTINWDVHTGPDLNEITDDNVTNVNLDLLSISKAGDLLY